MNISGISFAIILILLIMLRVLFAVYYKRESQARETLAAQNQLIGARKKQEDSVAAIKRDNKILAVVADGMGGLNCGEQASELAVKTFLEEFAQTYNFNYLKEFLIKTSYLANEKILNEVEDSSAGTTLLAAIIESRECQWLSIGDSSIFIYQNNSLTELNKKHTYKTELKKAYRAGEITRDEMLSHPKRDMLTSYLGHENLKHFELNKSLVEIKAKDKLLLCSDGVTDALSIRELESILEKNFSPEQISQLIIKKIKEKDLLNQDNATVVVIA